MSTKKYDIAKEFKQGIAAKIATIPCDWDQSKHFMAGYEWASKYLAGDIFYGLNEYLRSVGENTMSWVTVSGEEGMNK